MLGIFVDLENELSDIAKEVELLSLSLELYRSPPKDAPEAWHWITIQGFASGVEKVYSGCERVMQMIAGEIDHSKVDHVEGWHMSLLKRMAHPYPGVRDAVISTECYKALDQLRAFRHRQRNSYGLTLDRAIVLERAAQAREAFEMFRSEVAAFAAKMEEPASDKGDPA
jgi:hypothetical protein